MTILYLAPLLVDPFMPLNQVLHPFRLLLVTAGALLAREILAATYLVTSPALDPFPGGLFTEFIQLLMLFLDPISRMRKGIAQQGDPHL